MDLIAFDGTLFQVLDLPGLGAGRKRSARSACMLDRRLVFEIHRLKDKGLSSRQISRELSVSRKAVKKYLEHPERDHDREHAGHQSWTRTGK